MSNEENINIDLDLIEPNFIHDTIEEDIYARNLAGVSELNSGNVNIHVVGLGGIGSWTALFASYNKKLTKLFLWDDDTVDISNLCRTPYTLSCIDSPKCLAMATIINERRPSLTIYTVNKKFNPENIKNLLNNLVNSDGGAYLFNRETLILDCRDDYYGDYNECKQAMAPHTHNSDIKFIRCAYDTTWVTFDPIPEKHPVQGAGGYTVQPSHLHPAVLSAFLLTLASTTKNKKNIPSDSLTFNVVDFFSSIELGSHIIRKCKENKDLVCEHILNSYKSGTLNQKDFNFPKTDSEN